MFFFNSVALATEEQRNSILNKAISNAAGRRTTRFVVNARVGFFAGVFLSATAAYSAPVQWDSATGGNGHFYDFVILDQGITAQEAEAAAESSAFMGEAGYLATITSAEEQAFLNTAWPGIGSVSGQFENYSFFLIGASDRDVEGTFAWTGGDEEGDALVYENFASGEPNNNNGNGGDEDYVFAWWMDSLTGEWNDGGGAGNVRAYLVEYNEPTSSPSEVPLPASLPLLAIGLGGLTFLKRRKVK